MVDKKLQKIHFFVIFHLLKILLVRYTKLGGVCAKCIDISHNLSRDAPFAIFALHLLAPSTAAFVSHVYWLAAAGKGKIWILD